MQPFIKRYFPKLLLSHRQPEDRDGRVREVTTIGGGSRTIWWRVGASRAARRNDYRFYGIRSGSILEEDLYHDGDDLGGDGLADLGGDPAHIDVEKASCSKVDCGSPDSVVTMVGSSHHQEIADTRTEL